MYTCLFSNFLFSATKSGLSAVVWKIVNFRCFTSVSDISFNRSALSSSASCCLANLSKCVFVCLCFLFRGRWLYCVVFMFSYPVTRDRSFLPARKRKCNIIHFKTVNLLCLSRSLVPLSRLHLFNFWGRTVGKEINLGWDVFTHRFLNI